MLRSERQLSVIPLGRRKIHNIGRVPESPDQSRTEMALRKRLADPASGAWNRLVLGLFEYCVKLAPVRDIVQYPFPARQILCRRRLVSSS